MDGHRIGKLTQSIAGHGSRRSILSRFGKGIDSGEPHGVSTSLLAQAGQEVRCFVSIRAETELGPHADDVHEGIMTLVILEDGAIDEGSLQIQDGERYPLVGQVSGRSLRVLIGLGEDQLLVLTGSAVEPVEFCNGEFYGACGGPELQDIGTWRGTGLGAA